MESSSLQSKMNDLLGEIKTVLQSLTLKIESLQNSDDINPSSKSSSLTGWQLFLKEELPRMKKSTESNLINKEEIMPFLGQKWKALSNEERQTYKDRALSVKPSSLLSSTTTSLKKRQSAVLGVKKRQSADLRAKKKQQSIIKQPSLSKIDKAYSSNYTSSSSIDFLPLSTVDDDRLLDVAPSSTRRVSTLEELEPEPELESESELEPKIVGSLYPYNVFGPTRKFYNKFYPKVKEAYPMKTDSEVIAIIAKKWNDLDKSVQNQYLLPNYK